MTTFARISAKTVVGTGLCATAVVTALALSPHAAALQLKTGGYKCTDGAAAPVPGVPVCAAAAVEAMGVAPPVAVPPVPVAPPPVAVPPVPLAPPPIVPPVPLAPPVPVVPVPAAPVVPAAAPAAPVLIAAGAPTGKGVPTVSPGGGPVAGTPTLPGPADGTAG